MAMQCAAHPNVETELGCSRCGAGICPRCMVQTPVGARCRKCANVRRIPTYEVAPATLARGAAGAIGGGVALGVAWALFNGLTYIFFGVLMGLAVGFAVGELVALSVNRRAGPPLQAIAVAGVALAFGVRIGLLMTLGTWDFADVQNDLGGLIAAGIAAFVAAGRLR